MGRARVTFKMRDVDLGWKKLKATAKRIGDGKSYVKVGVLGSGAAAEHSSGLTNVELALIHEFGAPGANIPERSFLRSTFDKNRAAYRSLLKKLLWSVLSTKQLRSESQALGLIGARIASDVKGAITQGAGIPPPLQKATVERKGSERPLVDTGRLLNSITWEVHVGGRGR